MANKAFGVKRAAGVRTEEVSGGKPIVPAELGWVGYVGALQRGTPNTLLRLISKSDASAKIGGRITAGTLPDVIEDYFDEAQGSGGVLAVRVTDGNEVASEIPVYQRRATGTEQLGVIRAANGGRWGGAAALKVASVALLADIGETELDTGLVMKVDEWAGAELVLAGVTNKAYIVIGNDAAGVLSVAADRKMASDLAAGTDTGNLKYYLSLPAGSSRCELRFGDGEQDPIGHFSLEVYLDGNQDPVARWPDLHTNPDHPDFWETTINEDPQNYYIEAEHTWSGAHDASTRPAVHYGSWTSLSNTVLEFTPWTSAVDGTGNPTFVLGTTTDDHVEQVIEITMTSATAFDAVSDRLGALGSGTFGVLFNAGNKWTPMITISAGTSAMTTGDKIFVHMRPFVPSKLIGGYVYPDKATKPLLRYRVIGNDHKSITVGNASKMSTDVAPTTGTAPSGNVQCVAKVSLADGDKVTIPDGYVSPTFYFDVTGGYVPAGGYGPLKIRLDVSTATTNQDVAVILRTAILAMPASYKITSAAVPIGGLLLLQHEEIGTIGNVTITEVVANAGFTVTGMSGGVANSSREFMIDALRTLRGGRDGVSELEDSHFEAAWDLDASPFLLMQKQNFGLVKFATPGTTSASVQSAALLFAEARNCQLRVEIPANVTTESAADDFVTDSGLRSARSVSIYPSFGYVVNPDAQKKLKLVPLTGMIHGLEARYAGSAEGYHLPAAGVDAVLPQIRKLTIGDAIPNEEFLNPRGIAVIKRIKTDFVVWGNRTLQDDDPDWKWKHQRELMSAYEIMLREGNDAVIFQLNDPKLRDSLVASLNDFFGREYVKGALSNLVAPNDAFSVKIDSENNPAATVADGILYADILLLLVDAVEQFRIRIGKRGSSATQA